MLIHHLRLNALESPPPNLNSLLKLLLERVLPSWLDAATVFLGVCLGSTVLCGGSMGGFGTFLYILQCSEWAWLPLSYSCTLWPGNYVVLVSLFWQVSGKAVLRLVPDSLREIPVQPHSASHPARSTDQTDHGQL